MSLLEWMCGNLDFEDGSTAPFSSAALAPDPPPWYTVTMANFNQNARSLLAAIVEPSPLPPIGPAIVVREPPLDEPE
jgi:hypothetical protein